MRAAVVITSAVNILGISGSLRAGSSNAALLQAAARLAAPEHEIVLYAGLGEQNEAFRWLQKVEEDRSEWFAAVNVDPRLEPLHSDPRFAGILRSVGLVK